MKKILFLVLFMPSLVFGQTVINQTFDKNINDWIFSNLSVTPSNSLCGINSATTTDGFNQFNYYYVQSQKFKVTVTGKIVDSFLLRLHIKDSTKLWKISQFVQNCNPLDPNYGKKYSLPDSIGHGDIKTGDCNDNNWGGIINNVPPGTYRYNYVFYTANIGVQSDFVEMDNVIIKYNFNTTLPIVFNNVHAQRIADNTFSVSFDVLSEIGENAYNIQLSNDGVNFKTVEVVFPKDIKPNTTYTTIIKI